MVGNAAKDAGTGRFISALLGYFIKRRARSKSSYCYLGDTGSANCNGFLSVRRYVYALQRKVKVKSRKQFTALGQNLHG